ncbi:MAG: hypothetical protein MUC48_13605 [Leptolyngbya sp. Prado105]|jgi:hypothetical protein|nr:hypothetical protein [Leptolyngbya sp. Prado105]
MSKRYWIMSAGTGMTLLLTSCTSNRPQTQSAPPAPQTFAQPVVPAKNPTLPPVKIAGMIQTTNSKTPLMPVAVASNRDPFAAIEMPTELRASIKPAAPKTIAAKSATVVAQPVAALPQPQPIRLNPTPLPPISLSALPSAPALPVLPPVSRTNLAEAIAFTGVVQTGAKLSAIVQDTDGTSRSVQIGESLAGGEVTVKQIKINAMGTPSIVLLQNGTELIKSVNGL